MPVFFDLEDIYRIVRAEHERECAKRHWVREHARLSAQQTPPATIKLKKECPIASHRQRRRHETVL